MNRNCIVGLLRLFLIVTTPQSALGLENASCLARGSQTVCYTVVRNMRDFTNAEAECGRLHPGGRLATISSRHNQRHLEEYLDSGDYWIGARLKRLGGWTWVDGTNDVHWLRIPDSPIGRYAKIHIKEHGYEVTVVPAHDNPTPNETALCQRCADVSENCYFAREASRWHDARNACLSEGADLATLSNSSLQQLINKSFIRPDGYYFVGLRNAIFVWHGTSDEVKYTDWLQTDPIYHQECVLLETSRSGQWKWATAICCDYNWFVCEYATATEDNLVTSKSSLYIMIIILAVPLSLVIVVVVIIVCVMYRRRMASSSNGMPQLYEELHKNNYNGEGEIQTTEPTYTSLAPQPTDGATAGAEARAPKDCKKPNHRRLLHPTVLTTQA